MKPLQGTQIEQLLWLYGRSRWSLEEVENQVGPKTLKLFMQKKLISVLTPRGQTRVKLTAQGVDICNAYRTGYVQGTDDQREIEAAERTDKRLPFGVVIRSTFVAEPSGGL